jgi:hypothetical protein
MSFINQCWECGLTSFGANTCRSINKSNDHRPDRRENSKFCSTFRTNFMTAADNSTAEVSLASLESIAVPDKHPHNTVLHEVSFEVHPGRCWTIRRWQSLAERHTAPLMATGKTAIRKLRPQKG